MRGRGGDPGRRRTHRHRTSERDARSRLTCSPRQQNLLDIAGRHAAAGAVEEPLVAGFQAALPLGPQRGYQDLGVGLCGRRGRRLATSLTELTCPACRQLLLGAWHPLQTAHSGLEG